MNQCKQCKEGSRHVSVGSINEHSRADHLCTQMGGMLSIESSHARPRACDHIAAIHLTLLRAFINDGISTLDSFNRALEAFGCEVLYRSELVESS